ncbi:MAG: P-II family nitrogen regulator, partial [Candidatus Margulisiibacteriota bacterium]
MKKIEAIIRPEKIDDVLDELEKHGYSGVTITKVEGHGQQKGIVEQFRGKEYKLRLLPKTQIEIVVKNE